MYFLQIIFFRDVLFYRGIFKFLHNLIVENQNARDFFYFLQEFFEALVFAWRRENLRYKVHLWFVYTVFHIGKHES